MTKTNVQPIPSNSQHHDTPNNKTHVIKFRVTAEEKASLELTCKLLNLSLSTFIRHAMQQYGITVKESRGQLSYLSSPLLFSNIPPGHRSESSPHSPADHCR